MLILLSKVISHMSFAQSGRFMTMVSENRTGSVIVSVLAPLGQSLADALTRFGGKFRTVAVTSVTLSRRIGLGTLAQHSQGLSQQGHLLLETSAIHANPEMHLQTPTLPETQRAFLAL
jgi:hypothetical protein